MSNEFRLNPDEKPFDPPDGQRPKAMRPRDAATLVILDVSHGHPRILIGKRTGFAFYRDHKLNRKILIGVFEGNSRVNNYYDGPFDQLPDNFLDGNSLHDAILDVAPYLKGRIDRFGSSFDGETRYMVAPYTQYSVEEDLMMFHRCATSKDVPADQYHLCFVYDESEDDAQNPPAASSQPAPQATPAPPAKKASVKK